MCRGPSARRPGARPRAAGDAQRGFTLLEVLVAFIIASAGLAALFRGAADGLRNVGIAGRTQEAVVLARSHLSAFDALIAPTAEDLQGDEGGGYHWRLHVAPVDSMPVAAGQVGRDPTVLYQVTATISWLGSGRAQSVQLQTQRLTPVAPAPP